ncbi:MAG: twin-arginine translocation pathway signal protein, partial [Pseudomonadota bacterium]
MSLSRKTFLRVLGGGIVVAVGAAVAVPRLDAMPASAVEGWRGPGPEEADPRRRALAWALLAPNPHNLQAWAVDLSRPDTIMLHVDAGRLLPQTDPFSRQILIGHGCFLEILTLAAAADGHRAEVTLFPGGAWALDKPVARVTFTKQPGLAVDPLFAEVPRRRTEKGRFEAR